MTSSSTTARTIILVCLVVVSLCIVFAYFYGNDFEHIPAVLTVKSGMNRRIGGGRRGGGFNALETSAVQCRLEMEDVINEQIDFWIDNPPYPLLEWVWELTEDNSTRYYKGFFNLLAPDDLDQKTWTQYLRIIETWQWMWQDEQGNNYTLPKSAIQAWKQIFFRIDPPSEHVVVPKLLWPVVNDNMTELQLITNTTAAPPVYNLQPYIACNKQEQKHPPPLVPATGQAPKIGACITRFWDETDLIPEWITYHRMLGVEHFWFFVGEDLEDVRGFIPQEEPYITYIPYNLKWRMIGFHAFRLIFQTAANNECLYYAKQAGFDWIFTPDLDEFINIRDPTIEHFTSPSPLQQFLDKYHSQETYPDLQEVILFGAGWARNPVLEPLQNTSFRLAIDFTYRTNRKYGNYQNQWSGKGYGGRKKSIYNVHTVNRVAVHGTGDLTASFVHVANASHVELNHYRSPIVGKFYYPQGEIDNKQTLQDMIVSYPEVRDRYSDKVAAVLEEKGWQFPDFGEHMTMGMKVFGALSRTGWT